MITVLRKTVGGVDGVLCQDGKYRSYPTFGTYPECVKEYRRKGMAIRMADKEDADTVTFDPSTHELRAYGRVERISGLQ